MDTVPMTQYSVPAFRLPGHETPRLGFAKSVSVIPHPVAKNAQVSPLLAAVAKSQDTLWRG
jgi:hypothetical protein